MRRCLARFKFFSFPFFRFFQFFFFHAVHYIYIYMYKGHNEIIIKYNNDSTTILYPLAHDLERKKKGEGSGDDWRARTPFFAPSARSLCDPHAMRHVRFQARRLSFSCFFFSPSPLSYSRHQQQLRPSSASSLSFSLLFLSLSPSSSSSSSFFSPFPSSSLYLLFLFLFSFPFLFP